MSTLLCVGTASNNTKVENDFYADEDFFLYLFLIPFLFYTFSTHLRKRNKIHYIEKRTEQNLDTVK